MAQWMGVLDVLARGPENTDVTLTIVREGESDYLEVTVTRRKVETPTVEHEMLEDGMAYIQLTEFDDVSVKQFEEALASVRESDMKGLILDLRGNPGGSLSAVVEMAQMILPEGLIVYTEDKNGKRAEYTCEGDKELDVPLVVLVDMNSASAAEIMAGAISKFIEKESRSDQEFDAALSLDWKSAGRMLKYIWSKAEKMAITHGSVASCCLACLNISVSERCR